MRKTNGDARWTERGFTLVEMLIASFLFIVIMVSMLALFVSQSKMSRETNQRTDIMANARAAMDILTHDLRMAGAGVPDAAVYSFVNGDAPVGTTGIGSMTVDGADSAATYSDYIAFMTAPGQGANCEFQLAGAAGIAAGNPIQVPTPAGVTDADLKARMDACAQTFRETGAACRDAWVITNQDGTVYTTIVTDPVGGGSPYAAGVGLVNIAHSAPADDVNLPRGLPGNPVTETFNNGWIKLANDLRLVAYRISGIGTVHPTLQRAMANHCDGQIGPTDFVNIAENIEDLQFAFAYLDPNGDDNNINGKLEVDGTGRSPSFRYPVSYDVPNNGDASHVEALPTDKPHRVRYIRVSIVARTDLVDSAKVGIYSRPPGDPLLLELPILYQRPTIEDHTGLAATDGYARIFLQETVDVRNLNLPPL